MRIFLGIDLTEVARIAKVLERWGERFLNHVFEPGEIQRSRRERRAFAEHVAGRKRSGSAVRFVRLVGCGKSTDLDGRGSGRGL